MGSVLYLTQHWIFVVSYFRVSVVFVLVFSFHNEKIKAELRRREVYIYIFCCFGLLFMDLPVILALASSAYIVE